jgi:hypothetical protein
MGGEEERDRLCFIGVVIAASASDAFGHWEEHGVVDDRRVGLLLLDFDDEDEATNSLPRPAAALFGPVDVAEAGIGLADPTRLALNEFISSRLRCHCCLASLRLARRSEAPSALFEPLQATEGRASAARMRP